MTLRYMRWGVGGAEGRRGGEVSGGVYFISSFSCVSKVGSNSDVCVCVSKFKPTSMLYSPFPVPNNDASLNLNLRPIIPPPTPVPFRVLPRVYPRPRAVAYNGIRKVDNSTLYTHYSTTAFAGNGRGCEV